MPVNTENCMFLRECVCLRPSPGKCNKCGEDNKFSNQEQCFYCDCDCRSKNCSIDRNPSKKYFKIKSAEKLFNDFKYLGIGVKDLGTIVQNDMIVDMEELKDWLKTAGKLQKEFSILIKKTTEEILKKQVSF